MFLVVPLLSLIAVRYPWLLLEISSISGEYPMVFVPGASGTRTCSGEKTGGSSEEPELPLLPHPGIKNRARQMKSKQRGRAEVRSDIVPLLYTIVTIFFIEISIADYIKKEREKFSLRSKHCFLCQVREDLSFVYGGRFVSCFFIGNLVIFYWVLSLTTIGKWFIMRL